MKIRSGWGFLLLTGFFLAVIGIAAMLFTNFLLLPVIVRKHQSLITVPDIQKYSLDSALSVLGAANLRGAPAPVQFHEKIDSGLVIRQVPPPGSLVKAGRSVRLIPSLGPAKIQVPNLKGISVLQARLVLQQNNLRLGTVHTAPSNFFPSNMVIKSLPEADRVARTGSSVDLVVSAGSQSEYTVVPDITGKTLAEAEEILSLANLLVGGKTYLPSPNRLPETVLKQSLEKGTRVVNHTAVNLVLAGEK
jgi:eukaryotic-like serine/threonine-protein kinase